MSFETLVPTQLATAAVNDGNPAATLPSAGYLMGELIGKGGMGEVVAATDTRIGREVAVKRLRRDNPDARETLDPAAVARFFREARIQARLDHPAIVPVHELNLDADGAPYFTMKRLVGTTLHDRLGTPGPLQPLLRALVDVCFAIQLAHERGVVHRDLKPANIMLGDYNDTYVLDWGVARVMTAESGPRSRHFADRGDIDTMSDDTMTVGPLGTPGYMSPEQLEAHEVTRKTDIYALGAILFEILSGGEPLHPRGKPGLVSTMEDPQVSPAKKYPDRAIPPELDAACFAALARDPEDRPTARALGMKIRNYLDGDRDLERRRTLAKEELAAARTALASSDRALAVRRAGRALALDPASRDAAELVSQLIVEPPKVLPPVLVGELDQRDRDAAAERSKRGTLAYLAPYLFLLGLPWMHVRSVAWFVALVAVLAVLAGFTAWSVKVRRTYVWFSMVGNIVLALVWSRIISPFIITPVIILGFAIALGANVSLLWRRGLFLAFLAIATMLPIALELFGAIDSTWHLDIATGTFNIRSIIFSAGDAGAVMLLLANITFVLVVGFFATTLHRAAYVANRKLQIQAWHLQQLIPTT